MTDTEKIERNMIQLIDKERCGIRIYTEIWESQTCKKIETIEIKDETSEKALNTFKKLKEMRK